MPQLSPEDENFKTLLRSRIGATVANPSEYTEPIRVAGLEKINRAYRDMPETISRKMASRGYGSSGKFGNTMFKTEMGRLGQVSDWEGRIAEMVLGEKNNALSLGERLLQQSTGQRGEGTQMPPSNPYGNGITGGVETLTTLYALDRMLKGGAGPSGTQGVWQGPMPAADWSEEPGVRV